jgi:hypothetical protein
MGSAAVPTSSQASPAGTPGGPPASASAASANRDEVAAPPAIDAAKVVASLGGACSDAGTVALHFSPAEPAPDHTLSVIAVASDGAPLDGLVAIDGASAPRALEVERRDGPPPSAFASLGSAAIGKVRVVAVRSGAAVACADVEVSDRGKPSRFSKERQPWTVRRAWDRRTEDLYSAWVERLFDAKIDEAPSYGALHELTRDPAKNFLFDYLALGEDAPSPEGLRLDPDCADLPYYLRAYFSWKLGLPLGFSSCTRGSAAASPKCLKRRSSLEAMDDTSRDRVRRFERFVRVTVSDTVHSGTGRTLAKDDFTDYYPIRLSKETLRPGAIYADPYGHVLVVAKIFPETKEHAGALFAFDGQPDGTVGKKRFWQGNFLFSQSEPSMGNPGFKRFRPVRRDGDVLAALTNEEIAASADYGDFSLEQSMLEPTKFYDTMDDVLSPEPLSAERAMSELVQALDEQVHVRVKSVDNGEKHAREHPGRIDMPESDAAIFETTGDWEDFSTPSRDLRLLIAIDVVEGFPALVGRRADRFVLPAGTSASDIERTLRERLAAETEKRTVKYPKSDGSEQEISLAEVMRRKERFEVSYNPNDCAEWRWGAPAGSDEMKTCKRRAPADQRARMEKLKKWFETRTRPPRGG